MHPTQTHPQLNKSATGPATIELNAAQNKVLLPNDVHVFNRRWETAALGLLLDAASSSAQVTQSELQVHLERLGQLKPLNRAQLLRIVDNLKEFCVQHQFLGLQLQHAPRKASTGPWAVELTDPLEWQHTAANQQGRPSALPPQWAYPVILKTPSLQALTQFLQQLFTFEGFALYGQNLEALETFPSSQNTALSLECVGLLNLRRIDLLRRNGQIEKARQLAAELAQPKAAIPNNSLEPRLATQAAFALDRIRYDDDPVAAWSSLVDCPPPPRLLMPDPFTMGEWHNLSGIVLRRAILALKPYTNQSARDISQRHTANALFNKMMLHFESALYMAISHHRWDRLHAYLDNMALCLQDLLPLGFCKVEDVVACYVLAQASQDKLDSGNDDAWDMIFFGELWLNHEPELKRLASSGFQNGALTTSALRPNQKQYWIRLLERIELGAAPRQLAIALTLFGRWATQYRDTAQRTACTNDLRAICTANPGLREKLSSEGYEELLPAKPRISVS